MTVGAAGRRRRPPMPAPVLGALHQATTSGAIALVLTGGGLAVAVGGLRILVPVGWASFVHASVVLRGVADDPAHRMLATVAAAASAAAGLGAAAVVARADEAWSTTATWLSGMLGFGALLAAVAVVTGVLDGLGRRKVAGLWRRSAATVGLGALLMVAGAAVSVLRPLGVVLVILGDVQLVLAGRRTRRLGAGAPGGR